MFRRPLAANNEQGGIIAYNRRPELRQARVGDGERHAPINKLRVVVIREQNGTATTFQVTGSDAQKIVGAGGAIWLRLAKTGGTYKAYYSTDGTVWRYFATTTLNVEATKAGLLAFNRGGNSTDLDVAFDYFRIARRGDAVPSLIAEADGSAGGTVPATLALTLGAPATFGPFTPGVAKEYTASTTANVISTAGDAALTTDRGHADQRRVLARAAAADRVQQVHVDGPGVQRQRDDHVQAGDRRQRGAAERAATARPSRSH